MSRKVIVGWLLMILAHVSSSAQQIVPADGSVADLKVLVNRLFSPRQIPPFSFYYNGIASSRFIKKWDFNLKQIPCLEKNCIEFDAIYQDPKTGLQVKCVIQGFEDFQTLDWTLYFTNQGKQSSSLISQVKAADIEFKAGKSQTGGFTLNYIEGSTITKNDFRPHMLPLIMDSVIHMEPEGGRSSQGKYMPFFNIEFPGSKNGVVTSVGWTGNWEADLALEEDKLLGFTTGMKTMDLFLLPGESIRSPRVSVMFWNGPGSNYGSNKFRKLVMRHYSRKINGKMATYPLSSGFNYKDPAPCTEYSCLTEQYALAMMRRYKQFKLLPEVFWLDAGWHAGAGDYSEAKTWANTVGNWIVDKKRFPDGLRPIADLAHKLGSKFMVWFEPERVMRGTLWANEHPDWMLELPNASKDAYLLFDLANPKANEWLRKYIGDLIEANHIDYYRQDFNMDPDKYWAAYEQKGRKGMKEIRYVEGLYKFWDYLLKRFPELLIDNCASGGKRLDLETICRSAPLWRSDYYHYDAPTAYQTQTFGLNLFLPFNGTGVLQTDRYSFRSSLSSALIYNWKITSKHASITEMQRCLKEYGEVRPYFYEDYYPLTDFARSTSDSCWLAYQLNNFSDGSGIVLAFRHAASNDSSIVVQLKGLEVNRDYQLSDQDKPEAAPVIRSGESLQKGLKLQLPTPQSALLLKYRGL